MASLRCGSQLSTSSCYKFLTVQYFGFCVVRRSARGFHDSGSQESKLVLKTRGGLSVEQR